MKRIEVRIPFGWRLRGNGTTCGGLILGRPVTTGDGRCHGQKLPQRPRRNTSAKSNPVIPVKSLNKFQRSLMIRVLLNPFRQQETCVGVNDHNSSS